MSFAWTALALALLVVEGSLAGSFVAVFFAIGAGAAALGTACGLLPLAWQQSLLFAIASSASLLAARRPLRAWAGRMAKREPLEADRGSVARVLTDMAAGATGEAHLHGAVWTARNVGPSLLRKNESATVRDVEGLCLLIERRQSPPFSLSKGSDDGLQ